MTSSPVMDHLRTLHAHAARDLHGIDQVIDVNEPSHSADRTWRVYYSCRTVCVDIDAGQDGA